MLQHAAHTALHSLICERGDLADTRGGSDDVSALAGSVPQFIPRKQIIHLVVVHLHDWHLHGMALSRLLGDQPEWDTRADKQPWRCMYIFSFSVIPFEPKSTLVSSADVICHVSERFRGLSLLLKQLSSSLRDNSLLIFLLHPGGLLQWLGSQHGVSLPTACLAICHDAHIIAAIQGGTHYLMNAGALQSYTNPTFYRGLSWINAFERHRTDCCLTLDALTRPAEKWGVTLLVQTHHPGSPLVHAP